MKKIFSGILIFALIGLMLGWAISSEPVYIKGFKNIQDFKALLGKLMDLMKGSPALLDAQNPLSTLIKGESPKFDAIRAGDETTRIEVTKIYRQLDASRKNILTKGTPANNDLLVRIKETISYIEKLNNIKG
ncbi:MAG: hypothetical protein NTU60_04450 [Candidatus Aminicenantes bacterium]|nr:hypothetical protein [Candidatus Aminicenantes bacterium]